jgi:hypothetical protein
MNRKVESMAYETYAPSMWEDLEDGNQVYIDFQKYGFSGGAYIVYIGDTRFNLPEWMTYY